MSTQVVTVTASAPTSAPTSQPASSIPATPSTVTTYSFQFVTVTAPPPGSSAFEDTLSSDAVPAFATSAPLPIPSAAQNTTDNSADRVVDVEDLAVNEAVITSFANLTTLSPSESAAPVLPTGLSESPPQW